MAIHRLNTFIVKHISLSFLSAVSGKTPLNTEIKLFRIRDENTGR